ncbi:MAG: DUF6210 family protein, partial [Dehalococcoidia bacterium]
NCFATSFVPNSLSAHCGLPPPKRGGPVRKAAYEPSMAYIFLDDPDQWRYILIKMSKPIIQLWHASGISLILPYNSGIIYSNQTGGYACYHPEAEGIYIPLTDEMVEQEKHLYECSSALAFG